MDITEESLRVESNGMNRSNVSPVVAIPTTEVVPIPVMIPKSPSYLTLESVSSV